MRRALLPVLLVALACNQDDKREDPMRRCSEGIFEATRGMTVPARPQQVAAFACPDLYRKAACKEAIADAFGPEVISDAALAGLRSAGRACARDYCYALPQPRPLLCGEESLWPRERDTFLSAFMALDREILLAEWKSPVAASNLSKRLETYRAFSLRLSPVQAAIVPENSLVVEVQLDRVFAEGREVRLDELPADPRKMYQRGCIWPCTRK
jgi:hypothetical protein